jgi:multicomponent Na+:H+ antiporter subunit G
MIAAAVASMLSRDGVGQVAVLIGALLILLASIGVVRFPDVLTRMHSLAKASTPGVSLVLLGAAFTLSRINDVMSLLFATALQAATNPVATTLLTRAVYYAEGISSRVDVVDELEASISADDPDGATPLRHGFPSE